MAPRHSSSRGLLFVIFPFLFWAVPLFAQEGAGVSPNDPLFGYQPSVFTEAWRITHQAPDLVVAVIDSGINHSHPDLAGNIWVNAAEIPDNGIDDDRNGYVDDRYGYDFVEDDNDPNDEVGHGTIIAGIIGAIGNNGIGIAGAAWSIQLMDLKVLGEGGSGRLTHFVRAIHYAIDNGASIISAAWTFNSSPGDEGLPLLHEALQRAEREGLLVVAAAGNDGKDLEREPVYPASYSLGNLVSVAALGSDGKLGSFSNYGASTVTLAAPGEEILGTVGENDYGTLTGTSPAAAIVVGAAALVWSVQPSLTAEEVQTLLAEGADQRSDLTGHAVSSGELNVTQSLSLARTTVGTAAGTTSEGTDTDSTGHEASSTGSGGCSLQR